LLTRERTDAKDVADADALGYKLGMALLDYLMGRRAEIEAQIKTLKGELAEIRIAEAALTGGEPTRSAVVGSQGSGIIREGSIKDWVLKALAMLETPVTTDDIIGAVSIIGGPDVPRNSMTPQLSRLKSMGLIDLEGRHWRLLSQRLQNDETPGVQPPDASHGEDHLDLA